MNSGPSPKRRGPKLSSEEAQARLADALRANLKRRKSQRRARADQEAAPAEPDAGKGDADEGKSG